MLFEEVAKYYEKLEGVSSRLEMMDLLTDLFKKAKKEELKRLVYMTQGILGPPFEGIETGMADKLVELSISRASGFNKEDVEKDFKKTGDLGESAEKFISKSRLKRMSSRKFDLAEVFDTVYKIATTSGEGSQDAKIKMLAELLSASSPLEGRYITRFLLGTLRLGVGDATILEALSMLATGDRKFKIKLENAYNICSDLGKVAETLAEEGTKGIENFKVQLFNPIRPALAERLPTADEILEKMHGRCAVESKYDGLRAQVHVDKKSKKVEIFSRRLERLTPMFPEIAKAALEELDAENAIIEGEAIAYNDITGEFHPFQETIQRKRKHGIDEMSQELPLHLFAFDLIFLDGKGFLEKPYHERRATLEKIVKNKGTIRLSDRIVVDSPKDLERYFEEAIERGLEGIVAKELNSRYVAGARKFSWIKMKRSYRGELSDTVDLVILGYYLGKGTRAEFKFGGLLCGVYNSKNDVFETITKIGTGFSEELMKELGSILEKIKVKAKPARVISNMEPDFWVEPKYVVTVRADEITKSPTHTCGMSESDANIGYALRFPRIIGTIRSDKSPEDATTSKEIIEMFAQQKKEKLSEI
ncbi:MAG: ATP-dependent DNA ligase [Candidatus Micrarchaeia archaeon]